MTLHISGAGQWEAYSRPGGVRDAIGLRRTLLGKVLGKLPPHGSLAYVEGGKFTETGDTIRLTGRLVSRFLGGTSHFSGSLAGARIVGEIRRATNGHVVGILAAEPATDNRPLRDYGAVAAEVRREFGSAFFNPQLLKTKAWQAFFRDLDRGFARARDDLDAMVAFYAPRQRLPISHVEFFRNPKLASTPLDSLLAAPAADPATLVSLTFPAPDVAVLRVTSWNAVRPAVDAAFQRIDSARSRVLILDVRGNEGGDISAIAPATHLIRDSTVVGVFLGRRWYREHRSPPTGAQLRAVPVMADDSKANTVLHMVREHGALLGVAPPRLPRFGGEVYLLTDARSGSASEPLAHLLKSNSLATLVGERTAGAMLSAPPHGLRDGWVLVLPEADYFAADGTRLEGNGVTPHIEAASAFAMSVVAERIREKSPYAGTLLLGVSHQNAFRWQAADSAFAEAHRLMPDSLAPLRGLGFARQGMKTWDAAIAAWKTVLARAPGDPTALYQLGRTAALSGRSLSEGEAALCQYLKTEAVAGQPSHAAAHWRLGMILQARGALPDARKQYEASLALEPGNADAQRSLTELTRSGQ